MINSLKLKIKLWQNKKIKMSKDISLIADIAYKRELFEISDKLEKMAKELKNEGENEIFS
jgi:Txe/YoeB family toxin of Txe-Axe toxin-antitoxin module